MIEQGLIAILFAIIIHGVLRDGVATWVPNFIRFYFAFSNVTAILSTTLLPILSIVVVIIVKRVNTIVKNEITLSVAVFCIAFISSLALMLFTENFAISLIAISLLSACMHGINLLLVGNLPIMFAKYGKVSTLSGVLNACTYIGSSISAYGIAKITEMFGWNTTIVIWSCLCFIGIILCSFRIKI